MNVRLLAPVALASALMAGNAWPADVDLSAVAAETMAKACVAYAKAHNRAVNIWIYNSAGEVLHFERMDGAPAIGSPASAGPAGYSARVSPQAPPWTRTPSRPKIPVTCP